MLQSSIEICFSLARRDVMLAPSSVSDAILVGGKHRKIYNKCMEKVGEFDARLFEDR